MMNRETLAAIDIGSNAIRLLIKYIEQDGKVSFKKGAFLRVPIRLGEDVFTCGKIGEEKRAKLSEAMASFAMVMRTFNVKYYRACATSAMREAGNGREVVESIFKDTGIQIEIISGIEEAETIFRSIAIGDYIKRGRNYLYVDVGGGSTEVTVYDDGKRIVSESFPLGTVRMISDAVDKSVLRDFKDWLTEIALPHKPVAIIGSGGNINKIHKLLSKREDEAISYIEIKLLYEQLKEMSYDERVTNVGLNTYRADVIVPAMKIFTTVAKSCRINEIIVPKMGLADGIISGLYKSKLCKK